MQTVKTIGHGICKLSLAVTFVTLLNSNLTTSLFSSFHSNLTSVAYAAAVKKTKKKKRTVYIDKGSEDGVKKGMRVCINDKKGKRIVCGKIRRVKKKYSKMRVKSKKRFKKIKKGFEVQIVGLESSGEGEGGESKSSGSYTFIWRLTYLPAILTQTTYNKMTYLAPKSGEVEQTLWKKGEPAKLALVGGSTEIEYTPISTTMGFRIFRSYQSYIPSVNYDVTDASVFIKSTMSATAYGLFFDYYYTSPTSGTSGWHLGVGVDVDISTVLFIGLRMDDDEPDLKEELYNVKSLQTVVSLRLPAFYEVALGNFGIDLGLNLLVPVFAGEAKMTSLINDKNISEYEQANDEENLAASNSDILESIGHSKSKFGVEFIVGLFYGF